MIPASTVDRITSAKDREHMINSGLVVQHNHNYVRKLDYRRGQLSANGHHLTP